MAKNKIEIFVSTKTDTKGFESTLGTLTGLNQGLQLFKSAANAATAPFQALIREGSDFEKQMDAVASISKVTSDELKELTATARLVGSTTAFSATDAARAMEELKRAGIETNTIIASTADVVNLAAASQVSLADAAQITAVTMGVFAKENLTAQQIADDMVKTTGASAQNFENLRNALETVGPVAAGFGKTLSETTTIIGALANEGVRGEKAGTALAGAFSRLANPTAIVKNTLEKLKIPLKKVNPLTEDFGDILDAVRDSGADAGQILKIFGQEAGTKFVGLVKKGSKALNDFTRAQNNSRTASEAATVATDNLKGDINSFNNAVSEVKLTVFENMKPLFRDVTKAATNMVKDIKGWFVVHNDTIQTGLQNVKDFLTGWEDVQDDMHVVFLGIVKDAMLAFNDLKFGVLLTIEELKMKINIWAFNALEVFKKMNAALGLNVSAINSRMTLFAQKVADSTLEISNLKKELIVTAKEITTFTPKIDPLVTALDDIDLAVRKIMDPKKLPSFTDEMEDIDLAVGKIMDPKKLPSFTDEMEDSAIAADTLKKSLDNVVTSVGNVAAGAGDVDFSGIGEGIPGIIQSGAVSGAQQITGVTGAMAGAQFGPLGAAVGALAEALLTTQSFGRIIGKLNGLISSVLDPLVQAFEPTINAFIEAVEPFIPLIQALGEFIKLFPVLRLMTAAFRLIADTMANFHRGITGFSSVMQLVSDNMGPFTEIMWMLVETFGGVLRGIRDFITVNIGGGFQALFNAATAFKDALGNEVIATFNKLATALTPGGSTVAAFNRLANILSNPGGSVVAAFNRLVAVLTPGGSGLTLFNNLASAFQSMANAINTSGTLMNIFNKLADALNNFKPGGTIGSIFGFHDGGNVTRDNLIRLPGMSPDEGVAKLQAGETVIPRNGGGDASHNSSVTINVTALDPRAQAEEIREILEEMSIAGRLQVA